MKRFIFLLSLLVALTVSSQEPVEWVGGTEHNFGAFDENIGKVSCQFKFVNKSRETISVKLVHVTCGCTKSAFENSPVEPGDTGTVDIFYNPEGRPGRFEKKVLVEFNEIPRKYELNILGTVIGSPKTVGSRFPVEAGPLRLRTSSIAFGEVTQGRPKTFFLEAYNTTTDTIYPRWENMPDYIKVTSQKDYLAPGEDIAYSFFLDSEKVPLLGLSTDSIFLSTGPTTRVAVPVIVMVKEDFSGLSDKQRRDAPIITTKSAIIDFGTLERTDGKATRTLEITNRGKDPLLIRRVYTAEDGLDINVKKNKIKNGDKGTIEVTLDPQAIQGDIINLRLMILSNDPQNSSMPVRVVGQIK